jgi:hypothetical protein
MKVTLPPLATSKVRAPGAVEPVLEGARPVEPAERRKPALEDLAAPLR